VDGHEAPQGRRANARRACRSRRAPTHQLHVRSESRSCLRETRCRSCRRARRYPVGEPGPIRHPDGRPPRTRRRGCTRLCAPVAASSRNWSTKGSAGSSVAWSRR